MGETREESSWKLAYRPRPLAPEDLVASELELVIRILERVQAIAKSAESQASKRSQQQRQASIRTLKAVNLAQQPQQENTIAILGERGSGKTTTLLTVLDLLGGRESLTAAHSRLPFNLLGHSCEEAEDNKEKKEPKDLLNQKAIELQLEKVVEQALAIDHIVLPPIDPEMFNGDAKFILSWVFAGLERLLGALTEEQHICRNHGRQYEDDTSHEQTDPLELQEAFEKVKESLSLIGGDYRGQISHFSSSTGHFVQEVYRLQKSGLQLSHRITELFDLLFTVYDQRLRSERGKTDSANGGRPLLIISFDDIDMCEHQAALILHMIHAYLIHQRVVILFAGERSQFWWATMAEQLRRDPVMGLSVADGSRGEAWSLLNSDIAHQHYLTSQIVQKYLREENVFTLEVNVPTGALTSTLGRINGTAKKNGHNKNGRNIKPVVSSAFDYLNRQNAESNDADQGKGDSEAQNGTGNNEGAKGKNQPGLAALFNDHYLFAQRASDLQGGDGTRFEAVPITSDYLTLLGGNLRHVLAVRHWFGLLADRVTSPPASGSQRATDKIIDWQLVGRFRDIFLAWSRLSGFRELFDEVVLIDQLNNKLTIDLLRLAQDSDEMYRHREGLVLIILFLSDFLDILEMYHPDKVLAHIRRESSAIRRQVFHTTFFNHRWPGIAINEVPNLHLWVHGSLVSQLVLRFAEAYLERLLSPCEHPTNPASLVNMEEFRKSTVGEVILRAAMVHAVAQVAWPGQLITDHNSNNPTSVDMRENQETEKEGKEKNVDFKATVITELEKIIQETTKAEERSITYLFSDEWQLRIAETSENDLTNAMTRLSSSLGIDLAKDELLKINSLLQPLVESFASERRERIALGSLKRGRLHELSKGDRTALLKDQLAVSRDDGSLCITDHGEKRLRRLARL